MTRSTDLANRLFPPSLDVEDPAAKARRAFVKKLVEESPESGRAIEDLLRAEHRSQARRSRRHDADRRNFAADLIATLVGCVHAYARDRGPGNRLLGGVAAKRLRRLPTRLEMLANDIENLNASPIDSPVAHLRSRARTERYRAHSLLPLASSFKGLPRVLRLYAGLLRERFVVRRGHGRSAQLRRHDPALQAEAGLLALIEFRTGAPHYSQAATLLGAVFSFIPEKRRNRSRSFDEKSLQRRCSGHKAAGNFSGPAWEGELALLLSESSRSVLPPGRGPTH